MSQAHAIIPPNSEDSERALLGSFCLAAEDQAAQAKLRRAIRAEWFFNLDCQQIFIVAARMVDEGRPVDAVAIFAELGKTGQLDEIGGKTTLATILGSVPDWRNWEHYAAIVREFAQRRFAQKIALELVQRMQAGTDVAKSLDEAANGLNKINRAGTDAKIYTRAEILHQFYEMKGERKSPAMLCGIKSLDEYAGVFCRGKYCIIAGRPSIGKAQPLDAKVLTVAGWKEIGELNFGDSMASVDGRPSQVIGIQDRGIRKVYRVTFSDGRSTECCGEHLWEITYRDWPMARILSTEQLREKLRSKRYRNRLFIPTFSGEFGQGLLPIHPWILGALLGDGSICGSAIQFSSADKEIVAKMRRLLTPIGLRMPGPKGKFGYSIGGSANPLKQCLINHGLWDKKSDDKFIPEIYKNSSKESRMQLLEGLLDTDGWVEKCGAICFSTASRRLADDVIYLVRSIGGTATYRTKETTYSHHGIKKSGMAAFNCCLQFPPDSLPVLCIPRKSSRVGIANKRTRRLNVVSIEQTRETQTRCITVSHPRGLYITDEFTVTHNSTFVRWILGVWCERGTTVGLVSVEEDRQKIAGNYISAATGIQNQIVAYKNFDAVDFEMAADAIEYLSKGKWFGTDEAFSLDEVVGAVERLAVDHKCDVIAVDHIHLIRHDGKFDNRQNQIQQISQRLKEAAKSFNVVLIAAAQLSRPADKSTNPGPPSMTNLRDSGAIEEHADSIILLHRDDYYRQDKEQADGRCFVDIAKNRNGPRGSKYINAELQYQRFAELDDQPGIPL